MQAIAASKSSFIARWELTPESPAYRSPPASIKTILFPRVRYGIILNYKQLLRAERLGVARCGRINNVVGRPRALR